jgi:hypothetical protein
MGVTGDKNGLPQNNNVSRKTEPLVTVDKLLTTYLYGLEFKDSTGKDMPKEVFQNYIDNAVSMLEHYLDISITPVTCFVENRDYRLNEYADWGFFELSNYPVIQVRKIEMVYFRTNDGLPETVQEIPGAWVRLQPHDGIIRLIPNARFPANLQISATGSFFPEVMRSDMVPHLWRITYDYGFEDGKIPVLLNQAIGVLAAIQALIVGGNLVIAPGIASKSVSLDGLSQSINTTASAENSPYSATQKEFAERLFGKTKDDPYSIMRQLKDYYKGYDFSFL